MRGVSCALEEGAAGTRRRLLNSAPAGLTRGDSQGEVLIVGVRVNPKRNLAILPCG